MNFEWKTVLFHKGKIVAEVVRDDQNFQMFRAVLPDGTYSDLANFTRAKAAAVSMARGEYVSNRENEKDRLMKLVMEGSE